MLTIAIFLGGLVLGSFLNVCISRLHTQEEIVLSRSHCVSCKKNLKVLELIPLVSFLFLRGRCSNCKERISWQYPLVELGTAILVTLLFLKYQDLATALHFRKLFGLTQRTDQPLFLLPFRDLFFLAILMIIFVYDFLYYTILDKVTLPAIVIAFCLNLVLGFSVPRMLLTALLLVLFFTIQYVVSKGKWVGGGDIRLAFLLGVMLSWTSALDALLSAYIFGSLVCIILVLARVKKLSSMVPFGSFLAATAAYNILFGPVFVHWYLELLRV